MSGKFKYFVLQEGQVEQLQVIRKSKSCRLCVIISVVATTIAAVILAIALIVSLSVGASHHIEKNKCALSSEEKFDCLPGLSPTKEKCDNVGCCWEPNGGSKSSKCFYSLETGYTLSGNYTNTKLGVRGELKRKSSKRASPHGEDLQQLRVEIMHETENRLHIKVL